MKRLYSLCAAMTFALTTVPGCSGSGETTVNEVTETDIQQELEREEAMEEFEKSGGYGN